MLYCNSGCDRCSGALSDLSATLILLALRRLQNEAQRNNSPLRALAMKNHKIDNEPTATNAGAKPSLPARPPQCIASTTRSNT
jgi:hypothetical protein